ncbi:hypothetical protein GOODEAATRI_032092, partial [Goodea atripinnis]
GVSFSGFLWDSSSGIDLKDAVVLDSPVVNDNGNNAHPQLYMAHFLVGSVELTVVNVQMQSTTSAGESNSKNHQSGEDKGQHLWEKELVVLGDFGSSPQSTEFDILRKEKLCALVPSTQFTNISTRCPQGTLCLDNIWISRSLKKIYSGQNPIHLFFHGHCMVVREGLTNPWIPDNWSWGGMASDHCPVVAEFYADLSSKEMNRPAMAVVDRGDTMPKHER